MHQLSVHKCNTVMLKNAYLTKNIFLAISSNRIQWFYNIFWDHIHGKLKQLVPFSQQIYFCTSEWFMLNFLFSSVKTH